MTDRDVERIAKAASLAGLAQLSIAVNRVGPTGAKAIATSRYLTKLVTLDVGHNIIGPKGAVALAAAKGFGRLETLNLRATQLGRDGLRAVMSSKQLPALRTLNLSANQLDDAATALIGPRDLPTVSRINLDWNPIGAGTARTLAKRSGLEMLILLDPVDQMGSAASRAGSATTARRRSPRRARSRA